VIDPALEFRDPAASEFDELVRDIDREVDASFLADVGLALVHVERKRDPSQEV
jgi:hypothetical protein